MIGQRWQYGCALFLTAIWGCSSSSTPAYGGSSGAGGSGGSSGTGSPSDEGGSSGSPSSGSVGPSGSSTSGTGSDDSGTAGQNPDATVGGNDSGKPPTKDSGPVSYPALKYSAIGTATKISSSTQFYFTEGPVWDPTKQVLYFTDINAHQGSATGGAVYKLTLPSTVELLFQPDGNADGLGLDPQGNIIAAGYGARNVWRLTGSNTMTTLAPCSGGTGTCYNSQEINTPDDITSRSDGVIYFTDPTFGQALASGGGTYPLSMAQGVYRLTTDGKMHLEDSTINGPNGVNFSPDEKTLYVAYTSASSVSKFTVAADGSLSNKTTFTTSGATFADSMCVDAGGNVYVATSSGLAVYSPAGGTPLGTISCGGETVTNCAFGGPDQKTLFITTHTGSPGSPATLGGSSVYKVDNMPVPGIPGQN